MINKNLILSTQRLELVLLTPTQLRLWTENILELERELDCIYRAEPIEGVFFQIIKGQAEKARGDFDNYLWQSFFFLKRKSDKVVVGSADYKCVPNENGEVEIGYGLGKEFEHNGYMTEAVKAMCEFALKHPLVKNVIAETELDGHASARILARCGFKKYKEGETEWWRL